MGGKLAMLRFELSWDGAKAYSALFICFASISFLGRRMENGAGKADTILQHCYRTTLFLR
jgi:hypothetical protein